MGAKVINMSWGSRFSSSLVREAVSYAWNKGSVLVGAAGNEGRDIAVYPAAYDHVIGVSATDADDEFVYFSNYGEHIDVAAPGHDILSTAPGNEYESWSGTSMATPHVAGLAALVFARNPSFTPDQVEQQIEITVDDLGYPGRDDYYGHGRINAYRALGGNSPQPSIPGGDLLEPNNTRDEAKAINFEKSVRPTIYPAGDYDWFKVSVPRYGSIKVVVASPSNIDPVVAVYSGGAGRIIKKVDRGLMGEKEEFSTNVSYTGDYFVEVRNYYGNGSILPYILTITYSPYPHGKLPKEYITYTEYPTSSVNTSAVAVADLNGDERDDVATTSYYDGVVNVFYQRGSGGLYAPISYDVKSGIPDPHSNGAMGVAIGDVNHDGKNDLVVADPVDQAITVFFQNDLGGLDFPLSAVVDAMPVDIAVGDVNNDARNEVIAVGNYLGQARGNVTVLSHTLNDGLETGATYDVGWDYALQHVQVADVNSDQKMTL